MLFIVFDVTLRFLAFTIYNIFLLFVPLGRLFFILRYNLQSLFLLFFIFCIQMHGFDFRVRLISHSHGFIQNVIFGKDGIDISIEGGKGL